MNDREMLLMEQLICFDIDIEDDEFRIIDELMIQAPDEFGIDEAVTEKYLEENPKLKEWWDEMK